MRVKKASSINYVHNFSDITFMKFKPKKQITKDETKKNEQISLINKFKSILHWKKQQQREQKKQQNSPMYRSSSCVSIKSITFKQNNKENTIVFLQKITPQHYLIGNQNQLDLVFIGGIVGNFVDTQSLWEINIEKPIKRISIQTKKCYIAIQTKNQIKILKYDSRRIRQHPVTVTSIKTTFEGLYLRFVRDSTLAVFHNNFIEVFSIQQTKINKIMSKEFKNSQNMKLFQVPNAIQNTLNVFFTKKSQTTKTFQLWYIQLSFNGQQAHMTEIMKVYDIKEGLQKKIKLQNYSKQIFLMNLGFQILAVKKGYIIDSAFLNIQQESTFLHYIGNDRLLHLSPLKAQIYKFRINFALSPPRIQINSLDSIQIKKPNNFQYIGSLEMIDRNFAVFYQILPVFNRRVKGEIMYCFAITRHITIEDKIKQIFTFQHGVLIKDVDLQIIQQRVDMARKIGLNRIQIYLQLWNRTNKAEIDEFKFLLATLDYETIKKQIQKKLKKASMLFRQVYKIQQSCFDMIKNNLFSSNCSYNVIQQYLTSHYLLRKLQFYRDITMYEKTILESSKKSIQGQEQKQDALKINIQNYNRYLKADIKSMILQLIHQFCFDNKNVIMHIRIFLRSFRFIFRIIYKQLLEDIVMTAKSSLINLLEKLPQLLPYKHILNDSDDITLYEGVWQQITRSQWEKNIYIQSISTIDNRQIITEMIKSLWFRRFFLTQHDMTEKSKEQIIKINQQNNSDQIFYFFVSKVFEEIKEQQSLVKIIKFIQQNYQKMPGHLSERIFLYRRIFQYFEKQPLAKSFTKFMNFKQLLKMKDYQLFDEFFEFQKIKKGFLLKDAKRIYEQVGGSSQTYVISRQFLEDDSDRFQYGKNRILGQGVRWFNQGILSYFSSQLSQVSDLKYILNRINSQKRQFHAQNQHLIHVLVEAVKLKLKIGSDNDVPIQQVLMYLQGIPITQNNPVLQQLQKIQRINEQTQRFREIKLNMTIAEITCNCQNVINLLIDNEIKKRGVMHVQSTTQMKDLTYDIIAQIQIVKEKIYKNEYSDLTFFVYLTKIMQEIHMIPYAAQLLQDEYLIKYYSFDMKVVEDLILYMYKLKLTNNPKYTQNQDYLNELLQILPDDNECHMYIKCQLQYAKILSCPGNAVQYPLTNKDDGISIIQLEQRILQLPGDFLLTIDIQKLHQLVNKMQQICYEDCQDNILTSLNEIYEVIILKLIGDNKIAGAIQLTKTLLRLPNNPYGIVFPLFYIDLLSNELTVQCNKNLLKTVSFLFSEPEQLLKIVQQLMGKVFSSDQRDKYFLDLSIKYSQMRKNYNAKNPIFDSTHLDVIRNQQMQKNFRQMIEQCGYHLIKNKQEFNTFEFSLMFIILTQDPYVFGKYIYCKRYKMNYKVIRSFLSYIIKQQIFDPLHVLEFGRRIFNIICQCSQSQLPFESIASQYSSFPISQTLQFENMLENQDILPEDDDYMKKRKILQVKIIKCVEAFNRKKSSMSLQPRQNIQIKINRIQRKLSNPAHLSQQAPSEYPFQDSDDDYQQQDKYQDLLNLSGKKKTKGRFQPNQQRNRLMNRKSKNFALFMSSQATKDLNTLSRSKKVKHAKTLVMDFMQVGSVDNIFTVFNSKSSLGKSGLSASRNSLNMQLVSSCGNYKNFAAKSNFLNDKRGQFHQYTPSYQQSQSQKYQRSLSHSSNEGQLFEYQALPVTESQRFQQPTINIQIPELVQLKRSAQIEKNQSQRAQSRFQQYNVQKSSQEFIPLQNQQQFKVFVNQVNQNDFTPISKLKSRIIDSLIDDSNTFYVDLSLLSFQEDKDIQNSFSDYLKDLIKSIYEDQSILMPAKLKIIRQIDSLYPELWISKIFLDIYTRFQSYHSKYDISIPMKQMFPIQCIYSQFQDSKILFDLICPIIVNLVDQSNIYKISKIIHLAFKASSFEQQFFFTYLCIAAQKYDQANISQNELIMQKQKISALIQKLPPGTVIERGHLMIQKMNNTQRKDRIKQSMIKYLKKKKSADEVIKFESSINRY